MTTQANRIARQCVDAAKRPFGVGWAMLVPDVREAMVKAVVLDVVRGWETQITAAKIDALLTACLARI